MVGVGVEVGRGVVVGVGVGFGVVAVDGVVVAVVVGVVVRIVVGVGVGVGVAEVGVASNLLHHGELRMKIEIDHWLDTKHAAIRIAVGSVCLTDLFDEVTQTTRAHAYLPAVELAMWLLAQYEEIQQRSESATALSLASAGGGTAWPDIRFYRSAPNVICIQHGAELTADAAAVRYLCTAQLFVSLQDFTAAIDGFTRAVLARGAQGILTPDDCTELAELYDEVRENNI